MMSETDGPGAVTLGTADRAAAIAAVKAVARVTLDDEDALIAAFAESALGLAELFTGSVLIARAMTDRLAVSRDWTRIGAVPVRSIGTVGGIGADGAAVPLSVGAYAIDLAAAGVGWVRVIDAGDARQISVTIEAGIAADWAGLPAPIREGVALLAAHLLTTRDAGDAPPPAVTALWRPFRRVALARAARR